MTARRIARGLLVPLILGPAIIGWWAWDANLATAIYLVVLVVLLGPTLLLAFGSETPTPLAPAPIDPGATFQATTSATTPPGSAPITGAEPAP